jgi:pyruvate/2-oxoglutarate dehydrogenase complex dihydrolipoamide acyltransferase (E2) component
VLKEDILRFLSGEAAPAPAQAASPAAAPRPAAPLVVTGTDQVVPIRGIQRAMVKSMERAKLVRLRTIKSFAPLPAEFWSLE